MMRGLRRLVRDLAGRADREFVRLMRDQLATTARGVELIREMTAGSVSSARAREAMRSIEHAGDRQRRALVEEISRSLTTPIDREDLFRLSRSIDDVLDNLRDFVREADLFDLERTSRFDAALAAVLRGVHELAGAIADLVDDPATVARGALAAKKASGEIRRIYQDELALLFAARLTMEVLKRRELLRRLDVVGLRLGEAADALADGVVKRSH